LYASHRPHYETAARAHKLFGSEEFYLDIEFNPEPLSEDEYDAEQGYGNIFNTSFFGDDEHEAAPLALLEPENHNAIADDGLVIASLVEQVPEL